MFRKLQIWLERMNLLMYFISKTLRKDFSSFSGKFEKNYQNHGLFEGAVIGWHLYSTGWNWSRLLCKLPEICNTQKIICLSFIDCSQFKFFWELRWKIWPSYFGDPPTGPLTIRFRPPNLCYVKRPQLSHIKKLDP